MDFSYMDTLSVTALLLIFTTDVTCICIFPKYTQSPRRNGVLLPWKTKTVWLNIRNDGKWREQSDVFVEGSNMWRYLEELQLPCESKMRRATESDFTSTKCASRTSFFNRTCLQNDNRNTFRVVELRPTGTRYMCMMFLKRSDSVIQIMQGPIWERNVPELCDERKMFLEDWPWIASWNEMPAACPISGGFMFRTISRLTNQDLCEGDWRMSRLEVECFNGDGMIFISPKGSKCNPFSSEEDSVQLYCWAGWNHGRFTYMIGSTNGKQPQFCIRFPRSTEGIFEVFIYFSVICPQEENGLPPSGINYYELKVQRRDSSICEDEDTAECVKLKAEGRCETPKNEFVNHCPKSCGQCDAERSGILDPQCSFHPILQGNWKLIDVQRDANVMINSSLMDISDFGHFRCQSKFPNGQLYKTVSYFQNGCSKRYTCMEMERKNKNIMQFRIGKSYREEHSYEDMCEFSDDMWPLLEKYRSSAPKNLIYTGPLWNLYCGFQGTINFNGIFHGQNCTGTISDTNQQTCKTEGIMTIQGENCVTLRKPLKYQCLAYISKEGIFDDFLLTRSMDGRDHFNCWVISTYPDLVYTWPQKKIYQMPTPQCKMFSQVLNHGKGIAKSDLYILGEDDSRCIPQTSYRTRSDLNKTTTSSKILYVTLPNVPRDNHVNDENTNQAYSEQLANKCKGQECVTFNIALFCYFLGRFVVYLFTENTEGER